MKKIFQIAKLELSLLFYSPIAWLLLIVLIFQVSYGFVNAIADIQRTQQWYDQNLSHLTLGLFIAPGRGVFSNLLSTLYLYTPLITMGLISRETGSGTIKLLYSSPVTIAEIVMGKFVAMVFYNLSLVFLLSLVAIGGFLSIEHFEYGQILAALLGIFLLLCAYAAIGLFMSSLSTYQVVVAISTFIVFALLSMVGALWQDKDFFRDLAYSISMPGRTVKMLNGLITTRDVMYFFVIIYIFIAFTITKLRMARNARKFGYQFGIYVLIIATGLSVSYITSRQRLTCYWDTTSNKMNTLYPKTQEVLAETGDDPIEITEYVNFLDVATYRPASPAERINELNRWEPYLRFKPNMTFKWVYYYDSIPDPGYYAGSNAGKTLKQIVDKQAEYMRIDSNQFISPEEVHRMADLRQEGNGLIMQVKYKGRATFLRVFHDRDFWPGENEVAVAIKSLVVGKPKILFTNDGYERSINKNGERDYQVYINRKAERRSLVNAGFDIDTLSLTSQEIPGDIDALVIADRRLDYDSSVLEKVRRYINNGGNLLVTTETNKEVVNNKLLNLIGVRLQPGTILQPSKDYSYDRTYFHITPATGQLSDLVRDYIRYDSKVLMPSAGTLNYENAAAFTVTPLLVTKPEEGWICNRHLILDSAAVMYSPSEGDSKGVFTSAVALTRTIAGKQQRIVVTGDADFMSNINIYGGEGNFGFTTTIFSWFAHNKFPVYTFPNPPVDNHIKASAVLIKIMKIIYLWLIPGGMFLTGTILLIRRKRK